MYELLKVYNEFGSAMDVKMFTFIRQKGLIDHDRSKKNKKTPKKIVMFELLIDYNEFGNAINAKIFTL